MQRQKQNVGQWLYFLEI